VGVDPSQSPTAIVVGGAGAIGAAVCTKLETGGYASVVVDRVAPEGSQAHVLVELGRRGAPTEALDTVRARFSCTPVLINCAGLFDAHDVDGFNWADFDRSIQVNLAAPIELCLAWEKGLTGTSGGRLINVASAAGLRGSQDLAYTAAKAGLIGVTRSLAQAFAGRGISVFGVAPGLISTPMAEPMGAERRTRLAERTLLGREGRAAEVAELITFLATGDCGYMTGSILSVDAGLSS
jgi:3-oxoacyl-[acyl-carrier protein] reductase